MFDVRSFGATGDGATDDTAAIRHALEVAVEAKRGLVYFPAGIYVISGPLDCTGARLIVGEGADSSTIRLSRTFAGPHAIGLDNGPLDVGCSLMRMGLDGSNVSGVVAIHMGLRATISTEIALQQCAILDFKGVGGAGVKVNNVVRPKVQECHVSGNHVALWLDASAPTFPNLVTVTDTELRSSETQGLRCTTECPGLFVERCKIENNAQEGVLLASGRGPIVIARFRNVWFEGNWAGSTSKGYTFRADGSAGPPLEVRLQDCYFNSGPMGARAIHLTGCSDYVIDNVRLFNRAGEVKLDGNGAGAVINWPRRQNGPLERIVEDTNGQAAHVLGRLEHYESAWTDWTPQYSGGSGMTFTRVATTKARYRAIGKTLHVALNVVGTTAGVPSPDILVSLPRDIRSPDAQQYAPCVIFDGMARVPGLARLDAARPTSRIQVFRADFANWGLGPERAIYLNATFEID